MNAPLLFDWRRDEARRASRRRQQARQRAQERQRRMDAIIALTAVIGLLLALGVGLESTPQHGCACGYCGDRRCGIHGGGFHRYV